MSNWHSLGKDMSVYMYIFDRRITVARITRFLNVLDYTNVFYALKGDIESHIFWRNLIIRNAFFTMPEQNKRENSTSIAHSSSNELDNEQHIYFAVGRLLFRTLRSTKVLDILRIKPLVSNLLFLFLLLTTGSLSALEIREALDPNSDGVGTISDDICNNMQREIADSEDVQLSSLSLESSEHSPVSGLNKQTITCTHKIEGKDEPITNSFSLLSLVLDNSDEIVQDDQDSVISELIYTKEVCKRMGERIARGDYGTGEEDIDTDDIKSESFLGSSQEEGAPFIACEYEIQQEDSSVSTRRFLIPYLVTEDSRDNSLEEEKITRDDMEEICDDKDIYEDQLKERYDPSTEKVASSKLVLRDGRSSGFESIYPAYRFNCRYTIEPINPSERATRSGVLQREPLFTGLDLDIFCESRYEKLTKSTYHFYKDPYSQYCTNPKRE